MRSSSKVVNRMVVTPKSMAKAPPIARNTSYKPTTRVTLKIPLWAIIGFICFILIASVL